MKFVMLFINKIAFFMTPLVAIGTESSMVVFVDIFAARIAGNWWTAVKKYQTIAQQNSYQRTY